jgi:hypothetical protein
MLQCEARLSFKFDNNQCMLRWKGYRECAAGALISYRLANSR